MRDLYRNRDRPSELENFISVVYRGFLKTSIQQIFKFVIILSLCIWVLVICNVFVVPYSDYDTRILDSTEQILLEKQNAAILSEKLKNSVFIDSEEWVNISKQLQDVWSRLHRLEQRIAEFHSDLNINTQPSSTSKVKTDSILCKLPSNEEKKYQACVDKIKWMEDFWTSDPCYKEHGVDGTICSIRYYLSEVESWCPPLLANLTGFVSLKKASPTQYVKATWRTNLSGLMNIMKEPPSRSNYEWILNRIVRLWHLWVAAVNNLETERQPPRTQKKILIYLGFLSKKSGFRFQQTVSAGGPLGELVQWSDILSALYTMGHQMTVASEYEELAGLLNTLPNIGSQCQTRERLPFDMVITDIVGLTHFKRHVKQGYGKFSCLLRIIDTFGTEASFNSIQYVKKNKQYKTAWGVQELNLRQFYTMFPHSPDNSFMGFVVEQFLNLSELTSLQKKNQAVVYGKSKHMWIGKEQYLKVISNHVEIHATVYTEPNGKSELPSFVINHGILPGPDLQRLLLESKLFIGLGFPYEGPAPLEAIAAGCVFINPRFDPPHSSKNTKFFQGKPTRRQLTSQHPYAEQFISKPNVFTVDASNLDEVENVIKEALSLADNDTVKPYLPLEFTHRGMLERLNAYLEHQDFCPNNKQVWPPRESVSIVASKAGESCKDACWSKKLTCEPAHFKRLNTRETFDSVVPSTCLNFESGAELTYPAFSNLSRTCHLQSDHLLFSCIDGNPDLMRLCPCRKFVRGQIALCPDCF